MRSADEDDPQAAKGGKGSGICGRKRQATSTPEAAEAETQAVAAAAAAEEPAQAAPVEAAPAGLHASMAAVPEDGDL